MFWAVQTALTPIRLAGSASAAVPFAPTVLIAFIASTSSNTLKQPIKNLQSQVRKDTHTSVVTSLCVMFPLLTLFNVIKHNDVCLREVLTDILSRKISNFRLYVSSILIVLRPRTLDLKSNMVCHAVDIAICLWRVERQLAATIARRDVFVGVENAKVFNKHCIQSVGTNSAKYAEYIAILSS